MNRINQYPDAFTERMKTLLPDDYEAFIKSLDGYSPTSVRMNATKPTGKFADEENISWCNTGKYLNERPSFTFDPIFHAGSYYVQEASSMFLEEVWKQLNLGSQPLKVLDLCAAPGGKSTHLLSLMSAESLLVTNELIPNRNKILQQNIIKWGYANCIITQNKPEDFAGFENYFDVILIDAPCSGEGLFRKDKDAIGEWSEKNVATCAVRQKDIVTHAAACLKPGGHLIYSTCTYEPVENDENIAWMQQLGLQSLSLDLSKYPGVTKTQYGCQFYPHRIKGEGFYIAALQKEGTAHAYPSAPVNNKKLPLLSPALQGYLRQPEAFTELKKNDFIFAMPLWMMNDFTILEKRLYIRNAGILAGSIKGTDFLPAHDLALSNHIRKDIPSVELSEEEAITYLRCETPKINSELRGWCLATYQGLNLGWMKLMPGRLNNYFPKDWRILKRA
jgi:16S rRNA C967 or C1407 C5-methylase (RsmB/RsmF family)/NOL1/NOP2/fmu family ribosome biogenesis protein